MSRTRSLALLPLLAALGAAWLVPVRGPGGLLRTVRAGGPVGGACVRFKGTPVATTTDTAGTFRLPPRPAGASRVTAAREGYFIAGADADALPPSLTLTR